ncbi:MAG: Flp family type IVb pilin [Magnetovibrio sp.]|nr:Flp family type IVb pilin [Magnetovibrio sp.]
MRPLLSSSLLSRFIKCERGATAIEYALIAALIAVAIISALNLFATSMGDMFNEVSDAVNNT